MASWWENDAVAQAPAVQRAGDGDWWHNDDKVAPAGGALKAAAGAVTPSVPQVDQNGTPLDASLSYPQDPAALDAAHAQMSELARAGVNKMANGVMMGFAPRLGAAFDAAVGRAPSYAVGLASRNADQVQADATLGPAASTGMDMAGSALLPLGLVGSAMKDASMGGKVYGGLLTGGVIGGAQGAASAPDLSSGGDVASRASTGAMMGGALGAGLPLAGGMAGAVANKIAPFVQPSPIDGMSRQAFGLLSAANGPRVQGALDQLGPDAMLLDAAPQMKGLAQGVGIKPGDAQDLLTDALMQRNAGTNQRLATSVNHNLGPAISPAAMEGMMGAKMDATGPMYARALGGAGPIDISPVTQQLENTRLYAKGTDAARLDQFAELLRGPGRLADGTRMPEYDPQALQRAKFEMDAQIARTAGQAGSAAATATRDMVGTRSALNDAMADQIPGYADANLAYGTAARGLENYQAGRQVLRGSANPTWDTDFAHRFAGLPLEQQALQRAGGRADIEEAMRTNPNDLLALRRKVGGEGDFNRGHMTTLFGDEPTQNVIGDIDRNTTFRNNYNEIVHGSNTANKLAGSNLIDRDAPEGAIFPKNFTWTGLLANTAEGLGKKALGAVADASNDKVRMDLARALTAMGDARTPIASPLAEALRTYGQTGRTVANAVSNPAALGAALAAWQPGGPTSSRR